MIGRGELLYRIALAAIEVDRLRERKAAARKARNRIRCRRECNVSGGGRTERPPCWKNPAYFEGLDDQCDRCAKRDGRQRAYAQAARELGGARRRVTMLTKKHRRIYGDKDTPRG